MTKKLTSIEQIRDESKDLNFLHRIMVAVVSFWPIFLFLHYHPEVYHGVPDHLSVGQMVFGGLMVVLTVNGYFWLTNMYRGKTDQMMVSLYVYGILSAGLLTWAVLTNSIIPLILWFLLSVFNAINGFFMNYFIMNPEAFNNYIRERNAKKSEKQ